jgi:hypothetical protein
VNDARNKPSCAEVDFVRMFGGILPRGRGEDSMVEPQDARVSSYDIACCHRHYQTADCAACVDFVLQIKRLHPIPSLKESQKIVDERSLYVRPFSSEHLIWGGGDCCT